MALKITIAEHKEPIDHDNCVGGEQTVLGWTCYLKFHHHSEFPRKYAIAIEDGVRAVREFFYTRDLATCISWEEV